MTSLRMSITTVLKSKPDFYWSPKEIAQELHVNKNAVAQALRRAISSKDHSHFIPVKKVCHGRYQYSAEGGKLRDVLTNSRQIGIENLCFHKTDSESDTYPPMSSQYQPSSSINPVTIDPTPPVSREGYPRKLPSGQKIMWDVWANGSQRVWFVSKGRPFSLDLILYLLEELEKEGLHGEGWVRTSIEANIDSMTVAISPSSVSLQETSGAILKAYNHGCQLRYEIADRRTGSLEDTFSQLVNMFDEGQGRAARREVAKLKQEVTTAMKQSRMALRIAEGLEDRL